MSNAACCIIILGISGAQGLLQEGPLLHLRRALSVKRLPYEATLVLYTAGILVQSCVMLDEERDWVYMACEALSVVITTVTTSLIADQDITPRTLRDYRQVQAASMGSGNTMTDGETGDEEDPLGGSREGETERAYTFLGWTCFTCYIHNYSLACYDLVAMCSRIYSLPLQYGPSSSRNGFYLFLNVCAIAYRKMQAEFYYSKMHQPHLNPFLPRYQEALKPNTGV